MNRVNGVGQCLLDLVAEAFDRRAWHGTNLRGSIRRLDAEAAAWRPAAGRHNIHEIVVHAAYWKYAVRRRLTGAKRGGFALEGSNWFHRPDPTGARGWEDDVTLLVAEHRSLVEVVAAFPVARLGHTLPGAKWTYAETIRGIALHDIYHTGQIQVIKRLRAQG